MERNTWVKSSFSNVAAGDDEVQVYANGGDQTIFVRNSNDRMRDSAMFTRDGWRAFLAGVKAGEFDID